MMDISIPYYEDKTRISNSNIGWFLNKGPAFLHKMLTEDVPEEDNPVLKRGTMIHEYILQPEEFQKDYVVWDKSRPSSAQQEKFCQAYVKHYDELDLNENRAILSAYKEAYSTAGKSDDKMLSEGLKIASMLKDYIDYLKSGDQRIMIGPYDYQMLKKIKLNVENHKLANKIINATAKLYDTNMGLPNSIISENHHEFHINWEYPAIFMKNPDKEGETLPVFSIKCKSLLDGLTLDFQNKKATIYDLKTTQKLWHFEDSIEQYDYLRQLMYYRFAVEWYLEHECGEKSPQSEWTFEFYIIGIDTTGSYEIRVFTFSEDAFIKDHIGWKIGKALTDIAWHQMNNKWEHSRAYYEGDGSETLKL